MLEIANGRGFCWQDEVQISVPLRGRMSNKCGTATGSNDNDCTTNGGANCVFDSGSACKCKDDTFVDTAAGCKLKLAKCGDRCNTTGACDSD